MIISFCVSIVPNEIIGFVRTESTGLVSVLEQVFFPLLPARIKKARKL
jgi:hypothetical protein